MRVSRGCRERRVFHGTPCTAGDARRGASAGWPPPPLANMAERWRSEEKFAMGVETAALNEVQLGEYCRKRGVYPEEIKAWRLACEGANDGGAMQRSPRCAEAQADKRRIGELEGELRCK